MLLAFPLAAAAKQAHAAARMATSILHAKVPSKGSYLLAVFVRSRTKHDRLVEVYVPGKHVKSVVANPWWGAAVYYTVSLSSTQLAVRTVNAPPAVAVRATLTRRTSAPSKTTGTAPAASPSTGAAPAPTTTATSTSTTSTSTTSLFGTTPIFSENFQAEAAAGSTEPSTSNWSFDDWGSCGGGTLSRSNTNQAGATNYYLDGVNPDTNVQLTSSGLAITAVPEGGGSSYVSAQVDSQPMGAAHPGFSSQYGMIEASIEMPTNANGTPAQGLCPGFWMLGDNDIDALGDPPGEIDIVEAPSFGGGQGYPVYFDLHGTGINGNTQNTQVYSQPVGVGADDFSGYHTYAVSWTPTTISWSIDGTVYATASQTQLVAGQSWTNDFDSSNFHLLFTLSVGGWPCDGDGGCTPQTNPQQYTMNVQWVKWFPYTGPS
jgi:beta-glucanase (GH16 family)